MRDLAEASALAGDLLDPSAGLREHIGERRRVPRQQDDRSRACEVALQRAAVLVGFRDQRPLDLRDIAVAIELRHAKRRRDQQHADDQRHNRDSTHRQGLSAHVAWP